MQTIKCPHCGGLMNVEAAGPAKKPVTKPKNPAHAKSKVAKKKVKSTPVKKELGRK